MEENKTTIRVNKKETIENYKKLKAQVSELASMISERKKSLSETSTSQMIYLVNRLHDVLCVLPPSCNELEQVTLSDESVTMQISNETIAYYDAINSAMNNIRIFIVGEFVSQLGDDASDDVADFIKELCEKGISIANARCSFASSICKGSIREQQKEQCNATVDYWGAIKERILSITKTSGK